VLLSYKELKQPIVKTGKGYFSDIDNVMNVYVFKMNKNRIMLCDRMK